MQFTQLFLLHAAVSMYVSAVPSLPGLSQSYIFTLIPNMKDLFHQRENTVSQTLTKKILFFLPSTPTLPLTKLESNILLQGAWTSVFLHLCQQKSVKEERYFLSITINNSFFPLTFYSYPNNIPHEDKKRMCIHTFKYKHVWTHSYSHIQIYINICTKPQIQIKIYSQSFQLGSLNLMKVTQYFFLQPPYLLA